MKISGRFYLIQRTDENVVVACVGELNPFLMKENQISLIRSFYHDAAGHPEIVSHYQCGGIPTEHCNGFLIFKRNKH